MQVLFHCSIPFSPSLYKMFMASTVGAINAIAFPMLFVSLMYIHCYIERCIRAGICEYPVKTSCPQIIAGPSEN